MYLAGQTDGQTDGRTQDRCITFTAGSRQVVANTLLQHFNGRLSGTTRLGRYQKKHSPTHTHPILIVEHPLSTSSIYYDPQHPPCLIHVLHGPSPQSLSRYDTIRDAILTCARKPTKVSLIYRTVLFGRSKHERNPSEVSCHAAVGVWV